MTTDKRYMIYRFYGPGGAGKREFSRVHDLVSDIRATGMEECIIYYRKYLVASWNGKELEVKPFCPPTIRAALELKLRKYNRSIGRQACYHLLATEEVTRLRLADLGFQSEMPVHSPVYQSRKKGETVEVYETRNDVGILFRRPSPSGTGSLIERWRYNGCETH